MTAHRFAAIHLRRVFVVFETSLSSQGVWLSRWEHSASHQIQIRKREGRVESRGILRQAAVADFAKAPQPLQDVKDMIDSSPRCRSALVDVSLVFGGLTGPTRWTFST
jgi:hypothetical protein